MTGPEFEQRRVIRAPVVDRLIGVTDDLYGEAKLSPVGTRVVSGSGELTAFGKQPDSVHPTYRPTTPARMNSATMLKDPVA